MDRMEAHMHPMKLRLALAAIVLLATACDQTSPVSPLSPSSAGDPEAQYAVTLTDGSRQIHIGESLTLQVGSRLRRSRTIRWSSSNPSVASVNSSGTVTGRAIGSATILASGSNGTRETFTIRVVSSVASVSVTVPRASLVIGDTVTAVAVARDSSEGLVTGRPVFWSSRGSIIAVSATGVITALSSGAQDVQATVDGVVGVQTVTVAAPTITSCTISPREGDVLTPGQTRQYSTRVTWSDLATRASNISYSATGGTISSSGLFTAGQLAGAFLVIASCDAGHADTAAVTVSVPAQLQTLTISPKSATVSAGATQQFTTTANWSTGATTLPPVTYTTTGGTVSSNGLYVAPTAAGSYRVVVAHTGGTLRDTAVVTVPSVVIPPPAPPSAGMFFSDNFDNGQRNNANGFKWLGATEPTISAERAFSGTYAMRFQFNATASGGQAWSEERFDMGRYLSEVAVEYMLYVPANYRHRNVPNGTSANNKFFMLWRDNYAAGTGTFQVGVESWRTNDTESWGRILSSFSNYNWIGTAGTFSSFIGETAPLKPGQWNRIRFYVKAATARAAAGTTVSDGVMKMWVNNVLVYSQSNGDFNNFDPNVVGTTLRNGYLLGYANSGFDQTTVFYIDDVKFFQGYPGW